MRTIGLVLLILGLLVQGAGNCVAETTAPMNAAKVELEEPQAEKPDGVSDGSALAKELAGMPDGVLKVKTHDDGSFKSLVVKATVEIEDILGADKGKRQARREAEIACKGALARWLDEACVFAEGSSRNTMIVTKGESATDAAGNKVVLRSQEGKEVKILTENHAALAKATLSGLVVLHTEVTAGDKPEYILIMGLSDKSLEQAAVVRDALRGVPKPAKPDGGVPPSTSDGDKPAPQRQTNPEAKDYM